MYLNYRNELYKFYFTDPKTNVMIREINHVQVKYFYFSEPISTSTDVNQVCNLCLLKGTSKLAQGSKKSDLYQFDMAFIPPNEQFVIVPKTREKLANKICLVFSPISTPPNKKIAAQMEIQRFSLNKFIPRGAFGDTKKMATYREVWTAIKNGYFMSGFTNIPKQALTQGVVTSVNLERDMDDIKIFAHIHPGYPEIYIYCIDDPDATVAVTQFLINQKGQSVSKDLTDGEGIFFDGSLGHLNFIKPTYKPLKYCLYMWIIPTFGKTDTVVPATLWL
ncbi:MAG: hypothetical protein ACTSQI_02405 [Candidatus Helarchaeota archaeon]